MSKDRKRIIILCLILIIGLSLVLYPSISNYINKLHQTRVSTDYKEQVSSMSKEDLVGYLEKAKEYNEKLAKRSNPYALSEEMKEEYKSALRVSGTDVMAVVEIPSIGVSLPIYHGIDDAVLQRSIGHLEWSYLPIGGIGTHSVLCGHRGLPSSKLFTDLDMLSEGDIFIVYVLDEVLTYEVDQIRVVEPDEVEDLLAIPGEDLCTLETCTPYGVNTHRLLVRGHRVENTTTEDSARLSTKSSNIKSFVIVLIIATPIIVVIALVMYSKSKKKAEEHGHE